MVYAAIQAIEYYLPEKILSNEMLAQEFPDFNADKIFAKTGIRQRHIAEATEHSSDMAVRAAKKLFQNSVLELEKIDFLLFCTQTPDYLLPTSACLIQSRLGLKTSIGALDFNLGCSGYVYGLSLSKGLIESGQASNVLLLTADNYTKLLETTDKSVRAIFGDGASATLISAVESKKPLISRGIFGTDGKGAENLYVQGRSMRYADDKTADSFLRMKGPKIFEFTLEIVPTLVADTLRKAHLQLEDIQLFVFHQANEYILEHLRKKLNIPKEKFFLSMDFCGNTVSSTVPIALREAQKKGLLTNLERVMLVGFGVGYSWAANIVDCSFLW